MSKHAYVEEDTIRKMKNGPVYKRMYRTDDADSTPTGVAQKRFSADSLPKAPNLVGVSHANGDYYRLMTDYFTATAKGLKQLSEQNSEDLKQQIATHKIQIQIENNELTCS